MDNEKTGKLEAKLLAEVLKYSLDCAIAGKNFDLGMAEMATAMTRCLANVLVSSAITKDMDREQFLVFVDKTSIILKKESQFYYDREKKDAT